MAHDDRPRLVVIGSGWVGLYIAQYINTELYKVSIISPRRTSAYTPLLASAACGLFPFSCAEESLRTKGRRCDFIKAYVASIDFEQKQLRCEAAFDDNDAFSGRAFDVGYDILIISPGCKTNTFKTPGVAEHALFMKHVSDAMTLRKKLFDNFEKASLPCTTVEEAKALLHVAIVGGGPTGVEITAELSDLAEKELKELYPSVASLLRITIFDVAPNILGTYDQKLYEYATERMIQHGVDIATDCVISKVDDTELHVKGKDPVPYGLLLWVAGNTAVSLLHDLNAKKSEKGLVRIYTDSHLRVKKPGSTDDVYTDVFALGDAADIEGQSLPTTAEVAVQKAKYLVQRLNKGAITQPAPFKLKSGRLVTYIGGHEGIVQGSPIGQWSGREAWISWRSGSFTWTRTWRNWIGIILAWVMNALFGRDVMRL
ncbi:FAD/NAD(P)-binding domain-containing protein [Tothia fuscella]|uniref:FAD/NAD(P)-binding domain-containing protein n=1 Tax=Tothia fuscella TaxID=1048955 RepID=A0A9P4NWU2_9PEZI|nr:FAD/NAD(P)-binding domain-containing protein [Tothia fuscella]